MWISHLICEKPVAMVMTFSNFTVHFLAGKREYIMEILMIGHFYFYIECGYIYSAR